MTGSRYLRTQAAAAYCGLSRRTLEKLRTAGGGPRYARPEGRRFVAYDQSDLDEWMRTGRRCSTSASLDGTARPSSHLRRLDELLVKALAELRAHAERRVLEQPLAERDPE